MAVASDLPSLENRAQFRSAQNSVLYADSWGCKDFEKDLDCQQIAKLTGNENRILVRGAEISPNVKNAVIAIEDRRFYGHEGVDYTGIARALVQDVLQRRAAQGGSTITQQFVKNALDAQGNRSVFQKLRESALAYHLERQWPKDKILTQYLNTVYFGNGAYGIEAAVRTYFGDGDEPEERAGADDAGVSYTPPVVEEEQDPDAREAIDVAPHEAALLAGMIASPSMYDPIANPKAARARRDLVLQRMREMGTITEPQYQEAIRQSLPAEDDVDPPSTESQQPYFTTWMTEHLLEQYPCAEGVRGGPEGSHDDRPGAPAGGRERDRRPARRRRAGRLARGDQERHRRGQGDGRRLRLQRAPLQPRDERPPPAGLRVQALHPGQALEDGIDPNSTWASQPKELPFEGEKGPELFKVSNYEDSYLGSASLWSATATSDNSVFAELGMKVKPKRVARLAQGMGIRTELSTNPAMLLGGLTEGVTPLEMAYAYSTIANDGVRVSGSLAPNETGPVAIQSVEEGNGKVVENDIREERVFPAKVGQVAKDMLSLVVTSGTGKAAQVGGTSSSGARPAPPRTTATPGSSAATTTSPSRSGSATPTSSSRWSTSTPAARWPAAPTRRRSSTTSCPPGSSCARRAASSAASRTTTGPTRRRRSCRSPPRTSRPPSRSSPPSPRRATAPAATAVTLRLSPRRRSRRPRPSRRPHPLRPPHRRPTAEAAEA